MERTYVFGDAGSGGSKLDVTAMLPGMMGGYRGVDPNVLALMNGNAGAGAQTGNGTKVVFIRAHGRPCALH